MRVLRMTRMLRKDRNEETMSNLRCRALEDEYLGILRDLDGDAEGRALAATYLASAHPVANREGTPTWALTPKVLSSAELGILREAGETFGRILEKVTARFRSDADLRARFGLPTELEELALVPTGYDRNVPFARVDVLFDEETGDFTLVGAATDSSLGMTSSVEVTRAVQLTEAYRRFAELHPGIETFDVTGGVIDALRETYQSWANADTGTRHPERPAVGIVDYPESATASEFADIVERLADEGVFARLVDIRDLRIEEAGGIYRLVDSQGPIACVYRRVLLSEMIEKPCEGARALVEAARRGLACVIGGFGTWPVSTNALFAVLASDAMEDVLDHEELAFVRAHVPETHVLDRTSDLAPYLAEPERWLARPAGAYRANEAVAGASCADRDDWWRILLGCAEEGGVVQAIGTPFRTSVVLGAPAAGDDGRRAGEVVEAENILGLFLFRGEFGGVYARGGYDGAIGPWSNRVTMGCLVARD